VKILGIAPVIPSYIVPFLKLLIADAAALLTVAEKYFCILKPP
jgi:hypothetical protein